MAPLFNRKITQGTPDEGTTFFGIVKSGTKADKIGVINEGAIGETIGCFTKYADGSIEKNAEIKVDISLPEEFNPEKIELHAIAQGEIKEPRDLKDFESNEVQVQAFYGKDAVGKPFPAKLLELCFPEAQPPAPAPAPAPPAAPTPPASSESAPASSASPVEDDQEFAGDILLFYHPGEQNERIVNSKAKVKFWLENFELGLVSEDDFDYRKVVKVMGELKPSTDSVGINFSAEDLQRFLR